ncbi:MAG: YceI family protein [Frankia sp.]
MTDVAQSDLTGTWTIDPAHSRLGFSVRHAMVATVRGSFEKFSGTIVIDGAEPAASKAEVTIQADSISTGNPDRDNHLRTNDFLDAPSHETITFTSTGVKASSDDEDAYVLLGDLTVRGITKPVEIALEFQGLAKDPFGNTRAGFEGRATINRKEFGVSFNAPLETGGVLVADKVKIELDISAIKSA